ncbi:ABC transporter permease [Antrihabitans cavernicola]|uniref:Transport permease protein n=1 Tax=Antrihabitans cavernicola TaxID=2495913 RepID=A0A5A7S5Q0_9NOCA|nr:ABC transporter permease [Spelaeibacter cavernicola]KAA0021498.1 ABC transporter permease [Spelaeibacter cavernicola]
MTTTLVSPRTAMESTLHQAGWFTAAGQVFHRWGLNTLRESWGVGISLLQPIVWILLFGQVFKSIGNIPGFGSDNYITFLVPGVLMMTVLFSGAWAGTGYIEDIDNGVMNHTLTAPVHKSALVAGHLGQLLITGLVQSAIVLGIGFAGGARYPGGVLGIVLALAAATMLAAIFCSCSNAIALTARSQIALIGVSQMVVLPATFLSSAMMASDLMPGWVQSISKYNPVSWAVDIGRSGLNGTPDWPFIAWHFGFLAALTAVTFWWAIAAFRNYQRSL